MRAAALGVDSIASGILDRCHHYYLDIPLTSHRALTPAPRLAKPRRTDDPDEGPLGIRRSRPRILGSCSIVLRQSAAAANPPSAYRSFNRSFSLSAWSEPLWCAAPPLGEGGRRTSTDYFDLGMSLRTTACRTTPGYRSRCASFPLARALDSPDGAYPLARPR